MKIPFYKYQGAGNDFIVIDNRDQKFNLSISQIQNLCDRKFGIGSDGLILIEKHQNLDFNMVFFNPDGSQSFCGNGSRCAVSFAKSLKLFDQETKFLSTDGKHSASLMEGDWVSLKMHDVPSYEQIGQDLFINTGSPHYIISSEGVNNIEIVSEAHKIRYNSRFKDEGVNVNFIELKNEILHIRTYERGVENETLSCGTGVTAAALAQHIINGKHEGSFNQKVKSMGGDLEVSFKLDSNGFSDIYLKGPATFVFNGSISI